MDNMSTDASHDVAIVGGSLAGAATAIHLAQAGRTVVLLEKSLGYKPKACGEGLFPQGVRELDQLGLPPGVLDRCARLAGVRFHAGGATASAPLSGGGGLGIRREHLDPLVLARAAAVGVDVRRGVTVRGLLRDGHRLLGLSTDHGDFSARAVVGADGLHSRMRRLASLEARRPGTRYGISAHVVLHPATQAAFVDVFFEHGYELYVTPVSAKEANVALLLRKPAMQSFAGCLATRFEAVLRTHGSLGDFQVVDGPLVAGPFAVACTRPWRANLVLVGDAAGFFDGITGEGMSLALVSARHCAAAVDGYLTDGDYASFRQYASRRAGLVRNSNLLARVSLALGSRPALAAAAVRNLQRQPKTFTRLVAINSAEAGLRTVRPRDILALATGL